MFELRMDLHTLAAESEVVGRDVQDYWDVAVDLTMNPELIHASIHKLGDTYRSHLLELILLLLSSSVIESIKHL